jgi:predicted MFS family arabinose efflux permease
MISLTEAGTEGGGAIAFGALVVCVITALLFILQEKRASTPMLDVALWRRRPIATANIATLLSGMSIIGLTTFLPMYVQGVLGQSPLVAGFTLTAMVLGWPIGATLAARNFSRFGLRPTLLFGATLLPLGAVGFVLLNPSTSPQVAAIGSVVMGLGMGFLSTAAIVIIQSSVEWGERGAATASNIFARNLGSTLGATALGAVFNISLATGGPGIVPVDFDSIRQMLESPGTLVGEASARLALGHSLHLTFWGVFVVSVLTFVTALMVPRVHHHAAAAVTTPGLEP